MNFLQNFVDLYIGPEIEKRQSNGDLPSPFDLLSAQVLFCLKKDSPIIRLNSEVKAEVKLYEQLDEGIEKITDCELIPDEKDCGHVTMFRNMNGRWSGFCDFRYNRAFALKHVEVAEEFIKTSKHAKDKELYRAFIDNCFSASELLAKSILLLLPDKDFRQNTNHKKITVHLNLFAKQKNVEIETLSLFNYLKDLRGSARYLDKDFQLFQDPELILEQLERQYNEAKEKIK